MSDFVCKECGKEFESRKSFHCHLKAHSVTIGDYYVKHFQRKDLYTGDLLQFKNYDLYFNNDFNHFDNSSIIVTYLIWFLLSIQKKILLKFSINLKHRSWRFY